ncbi:MAG: shikimate dehydrogenase [Syntrophomonadaceae bacterium]|nr:shikimate dehydrogenase [Syntrophomonadaceae bacterium]
MGGGSYININADTKYIGLIGNPVIHSYSPIMHNRTFARLGMNCLYLPFEVARNSLKKSAEALKNLNFCGFNVTIPFKEEIIFSLDSLSEEASACGAVNVVKNDHGKLVGYNTDGQGFIAALDEQGVKITKGQALIIGAGGAARSVAYALAARGLANMDILDIDYNKSLDLAKFIKDSTGCYATAWPMQMDNYLKTSRYKKLIINCSPVGMYPDNHLSPVKELGELLPDTVLCDLIYNPLQTRFLSMGAAKGLKTINGLPMFVNQGALTLQILLQIDPPGEYMKEVLLDLLQ